MTTANVYIGLRSGFLWCDFTTIPLPATEKTVNQAISGYFNCLQRRQDLDLFVATDEHIAHQKHALLIKGRELGVNDSVSEAKEKVRSAIAFRHS